MIKKSVKLIIIVTIIVALAVALAVVVVVVTAAIPDCLKWNFQGLAKVAMVNHSVEMGSRKAIQRQLQMGDW